MTKLLRKRKNKYFLIVTWDTAVILAVQENGWKYILADIKKWEKFILIKTFTTHAYREKYLLAIEDAKNYFDIKDVRFKKLDVLPDSR